MTGCLSPRDVTTDSVALSSIEEGLCASLASLTGGPDVTESCSRPIDPASLVHMCTGHDRLVQRTYPHAYQAWTGKEAIR